MASLECVTQSQMYLLVRIRPGMVWTRKVTIWPVLLPATFCERVFMVVTMASVNFVCIRAATSDYFKISSQFPTTQRLFIYCYL